MRKTLKIKIHLIHWKIREVLIYESKSFVCQPSEEMEYSCLPFRFSTNLHNSWRSRTKRAKWKEKGIDAVVRHFAITEMMHVVLGLIGFVVILVCWSRVRVKMLNILIYESKGYHALSPWLDGRNLISVSPTSIGGNVKVL